MDINIVSHRVPTCACPVCGYKLDRATDASGKAAIPAEGDVSVCIDCTAFLVFQQDLTVREMTLEEVGNLPDHIRHQLVKIRTTAIGPRVGRDS